MTYILSIIIVGIVLSIMYNDGRDICLADLIIVSIFSFIPGINVMMLIGIIYIFYIDDIVSKVILIKGKL